MAKRPNALSPKRPSHSRKTKKRLAIKHARPKTKKKSNSRKK